jgi:hypothetical protein
MDCNVAALHLGRMFLSRNTGTCLDLRVGGGRRAWRRFGLEVSLWLRCTIGACRRLRADHEQLFPNGIGEELPTLGQNHRDGWYSSAPLGAGKISARCAVPSTRTLTERFSLKYSSSPLHRSFLERCIMNQNSARILPSRKECYAQKNRSPE